MVLGAKVKYIINKNQKYLFSTSQIHQQIDPIQQYVFKHHKRAIEFNNNIYEIIEPIYYQNKFVGIIGINISASFLLKEIKTTLLEDGALFIKNNHIKTSTLVIHNYKLVSKANKTITNIIMTYKQNCVTKLIIQEVIY